MASMVGLVPVIAAVLLVLAVAFAAKRRKAAGRAVRKGSIAWQGVFALLLLVIGAAALMGMYEGPAWSLAACSGVLLALGLLSLLRDRLSVDPLDAPGADGDAACLKRGARDVVIILTASLIAMFGMESFYNDWSCGFRLIGAIIEYVIIVCVLALLYFLTGRRGSGAAAGVVVFSVIGLAQYFIYLFKEAAIVPSDLLSLGTAAAVSSNYEYVIDQGVLLGLGISACALCLLSFVVPKPAPKGARLKAACAHIAMAVACLAMLLGFTVLTDYEEDPGLHIDSWFTFDSYRNNGFLSSFIAVAQDMVVEKPDGYTTEGTEELLEEYAAEYDASEGSSGERQAAEAQFEEDQPTVIVIMNETFSDLSIYDELGEDYDGPTYFQSLQEESIASGPLTVSVNGGGTCNSEFEFLTGNNMAFLGKGMYPYSTYDMTGVLNIAGEFQDLGYTTTAMHPNYATNWSRDVIYEQMGFDTFLSLSDFSDYTDEEDLIHNEVSDLSTYKMILELLEEDDSPQFIFDVTMQNHSGYSRGGVPDEYLGDYEVEGLSDEQNAALNEFLGCIESSDEALEYLIESLEELDREVIVVFFGDHQPSLSQTLNELLYSDEEGSGDYMDRVYQTGYFVWANYDVEGSERFETGEQLTTSNLAALMMDICGAPMTDYEKAQRVLAETVPAYNLFGFSDSDGSWYLFEEEDQSEFPEDCLEAIDVLERFQYLRFIDH